MSGKRQHFIPRFLQEGFISHYKGCEGFTWLYRKDSQPINTNIINVGAERFFYTDGKDTKADDLITTVEGSFSKLVNDLRMNLPTRVSDSQIPTLISHLEVRTRYLRQSFLQAGDYLVSRFLDFMSDEDFYPNYLERTFRNDPSMLREALSDELEKRGLPKTMLEQILEVSTPHLPDLIEQLKPTIRHTAAYMRVILPKKLEKAAKTGHIKALKKSVSPEVRIKRYKDLMYKLVDVPENDLILGDSVILYHIEGPRPYKAFVDKDDYLIGVILPLTSRRLLVGARNEFDVSRHNWPEAIARCSLEYFIANKYSGANCLLQGHIAKDAAPLTRAELEEIISEIMNQ